MNNYVEEACVYKHTAAMEVDGFIEESPAFIFLDNIRGYNHDMSCAYASCILTDPSKPSVSSCN